MLKTISPEQAAARLEDGHAILIDVREPGEYAARHVPGSLSMPLSIPDSGPLACGMDSDIIFTCQSGKRTAANAQRLSARVPAGRGFVLDGGVDGWARARQPIAGKEAKQPLPLMRQVQIAAGTLVLLGVLLSLLVAPAWIGLSAFVGAGLTFAGMSGWCGMGLLLARMPWNRVSA